MHNKDIPICKYTFQNYDMRKEVGSKDITAHNKVVKETEKNFDYYYSQLPGNKAPTRKQLRRANQGYIQYLKNKYPTQFNIVELNFREFYKSGYPSVAIGGAVTPPLSLDNIHFIEQFNLQACKDKDIKRTIGFQHTLLDKGADLTKPTVIISKIMKTWGNLIAPRYPGYINIHESIHLEQAINGFYDYEVNLSKNPDTGFAELKESRRLLNLILKQVKSNTLDVSSLKGLTKIPEQFKKTIHYELGNLLAYKVANSNISLHKRSVFFDYYSEVYGELYYKIFAAVNNNKGLTTTM